MEKWTVASGTHRDRLGEGPVWSARRNALLWVDILGQALEEWRMDTGALQRCPMPERIGWVLEQRTGDTLLAGLRSGVTALSPDLRQHILLVSPEPDRPDNRLNAAAVDPSGRLWFGTKDDTDQNPSGALYRLDPDLHCSRQDDGYLVTKGPAFSLDGQTMWHADSGKSIIYRFNIEAQGNAVNRREFLQFSGDWGIPDGMTIDAEGSLWVAHWGAGRVSRFTPEGHLERSIMMPASQITNLAFAGHRLDRLFVTSASEGREDEPLAGALFELDPGVQGVESVPFNR
jgi:xylono-1,5-lactonase